MIYQAFRKAGEEKSAGGFIMTLIFFLILVVSGFAFFSLILGSCGLALPAIWIWV